MSPSTDMCSDVWLEILSRVSLTTLGVCRAVSRQWNLISYEPALMSLRSKRTDTLHGYMVRWYDDVHRQTASFVSSTMPCGDGNGHVNPISLEFLRLFGCSIDMEAAHQGIVLCHRDNQKNPRVPQYIVTKPSTKQWVVIPNPRTRNRTLVIDLVVLRSQPVLHYKIVRVSTPYHKNYAPPAYPCEVFDSETWKWKKLGDIKLSRDYYMCHFGKKVTVSGTTCVLLSCPDRIFMFDLIKETWIILSLPFEKVDVDEWIDLVKVEGKLGVLRRDSADNELWLMKDRHNIVWCKTKYEATVDDSQEVMMVHYRRHLTWPAAVFPFCCDFEQTNLGPHGQSRAVG
ncbi:hypothetical protein MLD38_020392 [Melastoma candidum]|uniref:Uncharacterized protein n=1 Tax=Melastoma candidum TaxID=119954 RepID=A0ACB9QDQ3_9MYRT|nr:hypothetical protein MLD38_020392 [Melastoma candidum]